MPKFVVHCGVGDSAGRKIVERHAEITGRHYLAAADVVLGATRFVMDGETKIASLIPRETADRSLRQVLQRAGRVMSEDIAENFTAECAGAAFQQAISGIALRLAPARPLRRDRNGRLHQSITSPSTACRARSSARLR